VRSARKVVVVGLDGLDPGITERLLKAGELPNLGSLRDQGGGARIATTCPAQTPVAWSSFATGTNPAGHGIFDFLGRDPRRYLPEIALNRYVQKSAFLPPKVENRRRGVPLWRLLSDAGIPSTVLRCPCTYPPDDLRGRMLSGLGVPDVRGGFGTPTFYTSREGVTARESEHIVSVRVADGGSVDTVITGPRNPKTDVDACAPIRFELERAAGTLTVRSDGQPRALALRQGQWSEWLRLKFKVGRLQSVHGMVRFRLISVDPVLQVYASPVNFDPRLPMFPISTPWDYARELAEELGTFYTAGMVEDHTGLNNERIDEAAFLEQCDEVIAEREGMMRYALERLDEGFFFVLYDTPDRVQHMFWRFLEPDHPANRGAPTIEWMHVIDDHYRRCDALVGAALEYADDDTLVVVLSDHGFGSFQRGFNTNTWLYRNGFLKLQDGLQPESGGDDLLRGIDWSATKAYALGLAGIYLNLEGREARGIVSADDAPTVARDIVKGLTGFVDRERDTVAIRSVIRRDEVYRGPFIADAPDLLLNAAPGYRVSSRTATGGISVTELEDNVRRWSGDHVIDPELIPGVLFMNRPFRERGVRMVDMAPTILDALGVPKGTEMEGESVLQ
jgi:predicted AlkP superfamily phosphohydrolase/phosphomutase